MPGVEDMFGGIEDCGLEWVYPGNCGLTMVIYRWKIISGV